MNIIGISASLRSESYNTKLLRQTSKIFYKYAFEIASWNEIPAFNADLLQFPYPENVLQLAEKIRHADAVVMAVPEYNFSFPGMFKNALDWLSKCENPPLCGKPVAVMSAATGALGGARGQYSLRNVLLCMDAKLLSKPEVFVSFAAKKFDENGVCIDEDTNTLIARQMKSLLKSI